jgi:hypothetical protein
MKVYRETPSFSIAEAGITLAGHADARRIAAGFCGTKAEKADGADIPNGYLLSSTSLTFARSVGIERGFWRKSTLSL